MSQLARHLLCRFIHGCGHLNARLMMIIIISDTGSVSKNSLGTMKLVIASPQFMKFSKFQKGGVKLKVIWNEKGVLDPRVEPLHTGLQLSIIRKSILVTTPNAAAVTHSYSVMVCTHTHIHMEPSDPGGALPEWASECCWMLKSCMTGPFLLTTAMCSRWSLLMSSITVYTHTLERECVLGRKVYNRDRWVRWDGRKEQGKGLVRQLASISNFSQAFIDISFS